MSEIRDEFKQRIIQQYYVVVADEPQLSPKLALETAYLKVFISDTQAGYDAENMDHVNFVRRIILGDENNRKNIEEVIGILIEFIT